MAYTSVTNTFTNGTTASASQVNQNFTDIINGLSDGTKDVNINAATLAGNLIVNGNTTLGNSTSDDVTITGSLASSLSIKTNNTYDIGGSSLAPSSIYLGAPSSRSTRLRANQSLSASNTLVFPDGGGTSRYFMETDGSGNLSWTFFKKKPIGAYNYSISCSVGSNALTITVKGADGNSLSSTNPFICDFRSSTLTSGVPVSREVTSDISLVISSGSTLGHSSANNHFIYVYALDNAGTVELAASTIYFPEHSIYSSTAEGGAGAADSNAVLYSTTARTSKAIKLLGRLTSNQTTAGTWAAVPTQIILGGSTNFNLDSKIFAFYTQNASTYSISSSAPFQFNTLVKDNYNCVTTGASWKFTNPTAVTCCFKISGYVYTTSGTPTCYSYVSNSIYLYIGQPALATYGMAYNGFVVLTAGQYVDIRPDLSLTQFNDAKNWIAITEVARY
jgi:hypothetical protein